MDYTNDILARLQRGESVDNIAAQITKNLNDANILYAKKKQEAEARRKAELQESKLNAAEQLLGGLYSLLRLYDADDEVLDLVDDCSAEELIDELDKTLPALQKLAALNVRVSPAGDCSAKTNDPIEDFLNRFVR